LLSEISEGNILSLHDRIYFYLKKAQIHSNETLSGLLFMKTSSITNFKYTATTNGATVDKMLKILRPSRNLCCHRLLDYKFDKENWLLCMTF
jgi:hypothetical protein